MEIESKTAVIAFAMWLIIMLLLWRFKMGGAEYSIPGKIAISVLSLPIIYFIVNNQSQRD